MRFGTVDGRFVLVRGDRALDVGRASGGAMPSDVRAALARWAEVCTWARFTGWAEAFTITDDRLGPPVPDPRQVFAIALNYRPHADEAGFVAPTEPLVFTKFPTCITGPVASVPLPPGNVDWEVEVVVIIGRGGHRIPRDEAWEAVGGLTLGQDLSERVAQLQGSPPQFSLAKSHPGFGPIGPVAVTPDELPDRDDLTFESVLFPARAAVGAEQPGGEILQRGRTADLIFPVADLVARLSAVCPLLPGDLIFTGTPAGVGNRRTPPRFLEPGQTLVSRLHGVGQISQTFLAPSVPRS